MTLGGFDSAHATPDESDQLSVGPHQSWGVRGGVRGGHCNVRQEGRPGCRCFTPPSLALSVLALIL